MILNVSLSFQNEKSFRRYRQLIVFYAILWIAKWYKIINITTVMPSILYINEKQVKALRRRTPGILTSNQLGCLQLKFSVLPRKIRSAKMKKRIESEQPLFNQASQITTEICHMETKILFQIWNRGKISELKFLNMLTWLKDSKPLMYFIKSRRYYTNSQEGNSEGRHYPLPTLKPIDTMSTKVESMILCLPHQHHSTRNLKGIQK